MLIPLHQTQKVLGTAFKRWRDRQSSGTHSVMAKVEIKDGATKAEIEAALKEATKDVGGV